MNELIIQAMHNRSMLRFTYHAHPRWAEPHVYGVSGGSEQLLIYQIAGSSASGTLPGWRRVELDQVYDLCVLAQRFPGPRPSPTGRHSNWDEIFQIVC